MRVLYIGGTGEISHACVAQSVAMGHQVTLFNRGQRNPDPVVGTIPGVERIAGDFSDNDTYAALGHDDFDVVCQFLAYNTAHVERDINVFAQRCAHYVFVSTASAYQKPHVGGAVNESVPLANPYWAYSRAKAQSEARLLASLKALPTTIVRPSHTYRTRFPSTVIDGDHLAWRLRNNKPVLVHDDGESLWTLTHADDFAVAFTQLLGRSACVGEAYHITHDEAPSWNQILNAVADAIGKRPLICPVRSASLIEYEPSWRGPLLGDKANSMQFDNTKIRQAIGAWQCDIRLQDGLSRVERYVAERINGGYQPDQQLDRLVDRIITEQVNG